MASWLPHNKFAVAAEPVSAVNENVADKLRRYIKPGGTSDIKSDATGIIGVHPRRRRTFVAAEPVSAERTF